MSYTLDPSGHTDGLPRDLYYKTFTCAQCNAEVNSPQVKTSSASVVKRDPDFYTVYSGLNPLHYSVVVCPDCCFAAEKALFEGRKLIKDSRELRPVLAELRKDFGVYDFTQVRDLPAAAAAFEMAWTVAQHLNLRHYQYAGLAMRCAWIYREWADLSPDSSLNEKEKSFLRQATTHYQAAYERENPAELKLGAPGIGYLIGEIYRQLGDYQEGMKWLMRIATDRSAPQEVRRLARSQLDLARSQRDAERDGAPSTEPRLRREAERAIVNVYRDQARWLDNVSKSMLFSSTDFTRGLLDALMELGLDYSKLKSEGDIKQFFVDKLKADTGEEEAE